MQKYKYIANLDIDEIIVPKDALTWSEMMKKIQEGTQNKEVNTLRYYSLAPTDFEPTQNNPTKYTYKSPLA